MKTLVKKLQKDRALTIHVTSTEDRYLRSRKRETGLSISDVIREEYLSNTAETYHERKKISRNGRAVTPDGPPVQ